MATNEKEKALYWLAVGYVSPRARQSILALGGSVHEISHEPPFVAVGLAHDPAGYWVWSHGQRQHQSAIEFWRSGEIRLQRVTLLRGPRNAECYSVEETYLILPGEDFDPAICSLPDQATGEAQGNVAKTPC